MSEFIIGIDLGTTNCTMAYAKNAEHDKIHQFPIAQILANSTTGDSFCLPSFLFFPLEEECSTLGVDSYLVGNFAKERGSEMPHRLVHSSKSWLCHDGINPREAFLPLLAEDIAKLSPIQACAAILQHLKNAWNQQFKKHSFDQQTIYITVPASFDPRARELIQEAAKLANYPEITLLEEPLAAFYAWLHVKGDTWRKEVNVGDTLLIVDIGGGTTDFTIIAADKRDGNLTLERKAVGAHLLLGGDNIDLALAYLVKDRLENQGHSIDDWQLQSLVHSCRKAKEQLLDDNGRDSTEITVLGRGSRLIGGSLSTSLTKSEVQQLILDGYCPLIAFEEKAKKTLPNAISQISLPYASDPRITAQLASFLSLSLEGSNDNKAFPSKVLFNGGSMKGDFLRAQITTQLTQWAKKFHQETVTELSDPDYDNAVSLGAVYYGLVKRGQGVRVCGGTNRSYFVGIEGAAPAVPGVQPPLKALCLVPFGMEEGSAEELNGQQFSLLLGEPAIFRFFSRSSPVLSNGEKAVVGHWVANWKQDLVELKAIHTLLEKRDNDGKTVKVKLISKVTELGVLELWCHAEDGRKWKFEFDTRVTL